MLRVCGATVARDALSARRCWCGGLFCGRGGGKLSIAFRRAFHTSQTAASRAEFNDLIAQADLFAGDVERERWRARLDAPHLASRIKTRKAS